MDTIYPLVAQSRCDCAERACGAGYGGSFKIAVTAAQRPAVLSAAYQFQAEQTCNDNKQQSWVD
jgi:hypothetical protein